MNIGRTQNEAGVFHFLRLIILGMTGVGKSATGNTILRRNKFKSETSPSSLTLRSEGREGEVCGRSVLVVDTPGLLNTELSDQELREELQRALTLCDPGPHAFLLVIQLGRFSQQDKGVMETLQKLFPKKVNEHTIVLFTYGDRLGNQTIEQFIRSDTNLQGLLEKCGNRYHVFNNEDMNNADQVERLFEKINMLLSNKPPFYDTEKESYKKFATILLFFQRFARPIIGGVIGAAMGGLIMGVTGAAIGAVAGFFAGDLWRFGNRKNRRESHD